MKATVVVGERGQVTIPKPLRKSLGIQPGSEIRFEERNGSLVGTRVDTSDPIEAMIGLGKRTDVDALLAEMRGPAWDPKLDGGR
jgi:AbrB family looped-hinge helix DNA binding protein